MKADSTDKILMPDAATAEANSLDDPFAIDLFAADRPRIDDTLAPSHGDAANAPDAPASSTLQSVAWHSALPRISSAQARLLSSLSTWPPHLSRLIAEVAKRVVTGYTNVAAGDVSFEVLDLREAEFGELATRAETASGVWATLAIETGGAPIGVELGASLAAAIIDRMLGGDGDASIDALRALSVTEEAIVEFLLLRVISELNKELDEPLISLDALTPHAPAWMDTGPEKTRPRAIQTGARDTQTDALPERQGLVVVVRVRVSSTKGLLRVYLSSRALNGLDASGNPLLRKERARESRRRLTRFKQLAPEVSLHVLIGETEVSAGELARVEDGDVLVVEHSEVVPVGGQLEGRMRVRAGDGHNFIIAGRRAEVDDASATGAEPTGSPRDTGAIKILVDSISAGMSATVTERLKMQEENDNGARESEEGVELDGLLLTVHVELAARRVSLDELTRLRAGQLLELDCKATDPVDLLVDGRRVARGELVDIEGRLGVRITLLTR